MEEELLSPIETLSNELLLMIAKSLTTTALKNLCLVSQRMASISREVLYHSVELETPSVADPLAIPNFTRTIFYRQNLAQSVRHLNLWMTNLYFHIWNELQPLEAWHFSRIWADLGYIPDSNRTLSIKMPETRFYMGLILALLPRLQSLTFAYSPSSTEDRVVERHELFPDHTWSHPRMQGLKNLETLELHFTSIYLLTFGFDNLRNLRLHELCLACLLEALHRPPHPLSAPRLRDLKLKFTVYCHNMDCSQHSQILSGINLQLQAEKAIRLLGDCLACAKLRSLEIFFTIWPHNNGFSPASFQALVLQLWPQLEHLTVIFEHEYGPSFYCKYELDITKGDTYTALIHADRYSEYNITDTVIGHTLEQLPDTIERLELEVRNDDTSAWLESLSEKRHRFPRLRYVNIEHIRYPETPVSDFTTWSTARDQLGQHALTVSIV